MPTDQAIEDADRLKDALVALLGEEKYQELKQWIEGLTAAGPANPAITFPWNGMPYPTGLPLTVLISTDRAKLNYDVLLYKLPDTINEIDGFYNVPGAPFFSVTFPADHFVDGESYRIFVQVNPNPGNHNTHYVDISVFGWIPVYDREENEAAAKKGGGKYAKTASKLPARNGEKHLTKAGPKSGK